MKIEIVETGEQIEVSEPWLIVKNKKLYNRNTKMYEAVHGDIVKVNSDEYLISRGYTDFQTIPCNEDRIILPAKEGRFKQIQHNFSIKEV